MQLKYINTFIILISLLVLSTSCQDSEKSNLTLLSDKIPKDSAMVFGPDIVSTDNFEFAITFSPEMDELYFTRRKPDEKNVVYQMQLSDGKWSDPALAFFKSDSGWDFEPHINPKGDLLYFGSVRPLNDTLQPSGLHQWVSKKNYQRLEQPNTFERTVCG